MIPEKYRNILNPYQTLSEVRAQIRFLDKMLLKLQLTPEAERAMLLQDRPVPWDWLH